MPGGIFLKRDLFLWQFGGFVFVSLLGSVLHFVYSWTNESVLVAPFSAINESTWEHMKLIYFPMLIYALIQSQFFKDCDNFWCVKLIGILTGLSLIPILFYTLNGVLGKTPDFINIAIFFVATAVAFLIEKYLLKKGKPQCKYNKFAFFMVIFIGALFIIFTFITPQLPLFKDPTTE
jgi:hypothetical protein